MILNGKTLFCWSGGGLPGLDIHLGMWRALEEMGITADANCGTSAGAVMAALNSTGMDSHAAGGVIQSLKDSDVRKEHFGWKVRIPWIDSFLDPQPIKNLLCRLLPADFKDLKKPCTVCATDERNGCAVYASSGPDLRRMVLASMSIPGVFPAVGPFSDGGVTADLPIPPGWQDYSRLVLLVAKRPVQYRKNCSMLTRLMRNADYLMETQVRHTIGDVTAHHGNVIVLRPEVSAPRGALHFDHSLVSESYVFTKLMLRHSFENAVKGVTP